MITFVWGGCVPLAGVQLYLCLQDKGLGNECVKEEEKGKWPHLPTVSLSLFLKPKYSLFL